MDLRVVEYEGQILPLRFRESRSGRRIEFRRRLDLYCEGVFSETIRDPNLENIHMAVQDGPQRLFVRLNQAVRRSLLSGQLASVKPVAVFVNTQGLDFVFQCRPRNSQPPGSSIRTRNAAAGFRKRRLDEFAFLIDQ